mmetsp:Transcript_14118/g.30627  ORF Transcript_14118/g.30627 Transcript_14118/m.30627 type:complete len:402 (-) Transcript_14118:522-1727(-)|eukprot:CAMPEP_0202913626 /NCGR_PEP_ID=MMETSP1392-20130828/60946_1 /ASSEMBLY_ACC=CAM_ASM_000868 /TAXON_ID=225041 /ORGANISM="Chlamydomonas chlamydogama, Strain SAG 11-48b" /LENGTH=401 /DNA_ID=CAMNT_0049604943 /DNA_START=165 /DNA_END=1370 /DNA_ORIENTATION=+
MGTATEIAQFFDHLVDLIPAKHYYADEQDRLDLVHMKKAARIAAKQELKEKYKQNKRAKLDPEAPSTTLEVQRAKLHGDKGKAGQESEGSDDDNDSDEEDEDEAGPSASDGDDDHAVNRQAFGSLNLSGGSVSREELKEKLRKKIEAVRQQRKQKDKAEVAQKAKEWKKKTLEDNARKKQQQQQQQEQQAKQQRKQAEDKKRKHADMESGAAAGKQQSKQQQQQQGGNANGAAETFAFPRIEVGESGRAHGGPKGKKPTKEELLKAAEAKQKAMAELAASQEGKVKVQQEAWKSALSRAGGERVLDDPKLLRKSLKKESKRKAKSAAAWQERRDHQQEEQAARQNKRKENIQARVQGKLEKKKAKREAKLLRAGFEGRKSGFIGDKGGGKGAAPAGKAGKS